MGQRTCMIVRQRIYNKYDKKWSTNTYVFHEQWGIGKCLPTDCLALFLDAYRKNGLDLISTNEENNSAVAYGKAWNDTGYYLDASDLGKAWLNEYDFRDITKIKEFIDKYHDNNNGGVYVEITTPDYENSRINYAFFSGDEEEKKGKYCDKGLTYKQWMNNWKEYKVKDFDTVWNATCKLCGVEPFKNNNGKLQPPSVFIAEQG